MNDKIHEISEKPREMYAKKIAFARCQKDGSMGVSFKQLITSEILRENPNICTTDLRREVFLQMYGEDFSSEECEKIVAHLKRHVKNRD